MSCKNVVVYIYDEALICGSHYHGVYHYCDECLKAKQHELNVINKKINKLNGQIYDLEIMANGLKKDINDNLPPEKKELL